MRSTAARVCTRDLHAHVRRSSELGATSEAHSYFLLSDQPDEGFVSFMADFVFVNTNLVPTTNLLSLLLCLQKRMKERILKIFFFCKAFMLMAPPCPESISLTAAPFPPYIARKARKMLMKETRKSEGNSGSGLCVTLTPSLHHSYP